MRCLLCLLWAWSAFAADPETAVVTGRVVDVYHRPVRSARVATMERQVTAGPTRLVAGTQGNVDDAGMYRLSLPPGRYILAVLPPPGGLDFATVFPAYFQDTVDFQKAQPIDLRPGEIRPFTDFLLLDVESHRLAGEVTGIPEDAGSVAVVLFASSGYTEPLRTVMTDSRGRFQFDHVSAGSYELHVGPDRLAGAPSMSGSVHVDVKAPEIGNIRIQLRAARR